MTAPAALVDVRSANRALVWLARFLVLVTVFFGLGTVVALGTLPASLDDAGVGVHAVISGDYSVTSPAEAAFSFRNNVVYNEPRTFNGRSIDLQDSSLHVTVAVPPGNRDARLTISAGLLVAIALGWIGLVVVRRIVRSARAGDPFDRRNVARLRCLAAVVVAVRVVASVVNWGLERTLDWPYWLHAKVTEVGVTPVLILALAILALAEIFREGANLRELEQSTI